jgi:hypothetical protein
MKRTNLKIRKLLLGCLLETTDSDGRRGAFSDKQHLFSFNQFRQTEKNVSLPFKKNHAFRIAFFKQSGTFFD